MKTTLTVQNSTIENNPSDKFPNEPDESEMLRLCRRGRIGAARVRIHKGKYWELDFSHPGGVHLPRRRRYCSSPTQAVREARRITQEIREHGTLARALSTGQRWVASQCFARLGKVYDEDPTHLLRIVDEHMRRHPLGGNARAMDDVRKELVAKKAKTGRSERHVKGLDYKLRTLIAALGNKAITCVTTQDLEDELDRHPDWKATTVHSTTQGWKVMFNFAVKRGYLVENPADKIELPAIVREEPKILTVDQAKRLMAATLFRDRDPLLPACRAYLAIGMFAGIRPEEMVRLDWSDVDLRTASITIQGAKAKCRARRIVDIHPNLLEWLRPLARPRGKVLRHPIAQLRAAARAVLGLPEWPHDVLRHTFGSYHFAHHRNEALVKNRMGHSDDGRMFFHHYRVLVHPHDAAHFWGIVPPLGLLPC